MTSLLDPLAAMDSPGPLISGPDPLAATPMDVQNLPASDGKPIQLSSGKKIHETELKKRSLCLKVVIHEWGNRAKGDIALCETDAEKELLGINKQLLVSPELKKISEQSSKIRAYVKSRTTPSFFSKGVFTLSYDLINEVDRKLKQLSNERQQLVANFLGVYPKQVGEALARLNSQYRERDYPLAEFLPGRFRLEWSYAAFLSAPDQLQEFNQSIYESQRDRYEQMFQEVYDSTRMFLRTEFAQMAQHLAIKLEPDQDGKRKKLYTSTFTAISEFLDYFDKRNLTDDQELGSLVKRLRAVMNGVSLDELKDVESSHREIVKNALANVIEASNKPGFIISINRVYDFED